MTVITKKDTSGNFKDVLKAAGIDVDRNFEPMVARANLFGSGGTPVSFINTREYLTP